MVRRVYGHRDEVQGGEEGVHPLEGEGEEVDRPPHQVQAPVTL